MANKIDRTMFANITVKLVLGVASSAAASRLSSVIRDGITSSDPNFGSLAAVGIISIAIGLLLIIRVWVGKKNILTNTTWFVLFVLGWSLSVFGVSLLSSVYPGQFINIR